MSAVLYNTVHSGDLKVFVAKYHFEFLGGTATKIT